MTRRGENSHHFVGRNNIARNKRSICKTIKGSKTINVLLPFYLNDIGNTISLLQKQEYILHSNLQQSL